MADLIDAKSATLESIKNVFEAAYFDVEINDGDLKIEGKNYTFWAVLDKNKQFLRYYVLIQRNKKAKDSQLLKFISEVTDYPLIRPMVLDNVFGFDCYVWLENGISKKNIITSFRAFEEISQYAISEDQFNVLL